MWTFADMPSPTAAEVGAWLVSFVALLAIPIALLAIANGWRKFQTPHPVRKATDEYATRDELESGLGKLRAEIVQVEKDIRAEFGAMESKLTGRFDKLDDYAQRRLHEISNVTNDVKLAIAKQPMEARKMIDDALAPINRKLELIVAAFGTRVVPLNPTEGGA